MRATRLTYKHKHSYKTLWFGLAGAFVMIVGSILFGYAQGQKQEAEKMNPTKPVLNDAELRENTVLDDIVSTAGDLLGGLEQEDNFAREVSGIGAD